MPFMTMLPMHRAIVRPTAPVITTTTLPAGVDGEAYSETLGKTGFDGGTWSIVQGDLPDGMTLNTATGNLGGTPEEVGEFTFTVGYTDPYGQFDDQALALEIESGFPAYTIYGSDGMSGTGNVHGDTFDDEFSGDGGSWNSATAGTVVTETGGIATMPDGATAEVMICSDAQWPNEPADCGVLVQGFKGGGAIPNFMADRRDDTNGDAIMLKLQEGSKPAVVIATATLINPVVNDASTTTFNGAFNVTNTEMNYLLRCIEVAGAGGGYTCELYAGAWESGQTEEEVIGGLSLIESMDIFTADARTMRDSTATGRQRGMIRRAGAAGTACTFDGVHWLTFNP
jgi:hypothetical protein